VSLSSETLLGKSLSFLLANVANVCHLLGPLGRAPVLMLEVGGQGGVECRGRRGRQMEVMGGWQGSWPSSFLLTRV
jgi:hypothetical protein